MVGHGYNDRLLEGAIRCPDCGSLRIEYPQYTRKFITPLLVELLISMGFAEKKFFCKDCQYTWPANPKRKTERDILGWPKEDQRTTPEPADHNRLERSETSDSRPSKTPPQN